MTRVVAIGRSVELAGYALAGVEVIDADSPERVLRAWEEVGGDASLVLLTATARHALPDRLDGGRSLWVVLPG